MRWCRELVRRTSRAQSEKVRIGWSRNPGVWTAGRDAQVAHGGLGNHERSTARHRRPGSQLKLNRLAGIAMELPLLRQKRSEGIAQLRLKCVDGREA